MIINPGDLETKDLHQFIIGSVAPRPIAFASTLDENGVPNIAPYSFFNAFSSNPPIVVFSSNRRVSNNTTKDTLHNIEKTGEVVINMVNYDIVHQMALSSIEYPADVSEFEKAGLSPVPSDLVRPFRIMESPVNMGCRVREINTLGKEGGAGHLIICDVLRLHIKDEIIDNGRINPHKIDLVGRMGRAYYCRASGDAVFTLYQPVTRLGIGWDGLPQSIRESKVLNGKEISALATLPNKPTESELNNFLSTEKGKAFLSIPKGVERHYHLKKYLKDPETALHMAFSIED
jgi:flavin reductase (DIM6/NTAB) family NADH-FMN oxidoreductase RutF